MTSKMIQRQVQQGLCIQGRGQERASYMCWVEVGERRQEHAAMRETGNKVRSMMEVKKESWGLTWSNNHSKMKLFPFISQAIHVLIRRFS